MAVHPFGVLIADAVLELIDGVPVSPRRSPPASFVPRRLQRPEPHRRRALGVGEVTGPGR